MINFDKRSHHFETPAAQSGKAHAKPFNKTDISHRCGFFDAGMLSPDQLYIRLQTNKDTDRVILMADDPYARNWTGKPVKMEPVWELEDKRIWQAVLQPPLRRLQYYFQIHQKDQYMDLLEDGLHESDQIGKPGHFDQYFKFGWMNPADFSPAPAWVANTVWYQIMPDRFCKDSQALEKEAEHSRRCTYTDQPFMNWDKEEIHYKDFFGGTIKGITQKLDYLQDLGINGLYMTPIFASSSNHKYNIYDYHHIDPDFGTDEDFLELVEQAHARGIRVMIDAVFNHSGIQHEAWQDIQEHGKDSPYWDWYFVNSDHQTKWNVEDGSYYAFAYAGYMPKLNTSHPDVQQHMKDLCLEWIDHWHVDGIRFDVGNEVSHQLIRKIREAVTEKYPDTYLLGEIWTESGSWLLGDQYDSVMNYPWLFALYDFFDNPDMSAREYMWKLNRVYTLYAPTTNPVLFNFLDTHDIGRIFSRYPNPDVLIQQLSLLCTLPGTPCIFYGTELASTGDHDPANRKPFDWTALSLPDNQKRIQQIASLFELRKTSPALAGDRIEWIIEEDPAARRIIHFLRKDPEGNQCLEMILNASRQPVNPDSLSSAACQDPEARQNRAAFQEPALVRSQPVVLFANHFTHSVLEPNGILIRKI